LFHRSPFYFSSRLGNPRKKLKVRKIPQLGTVPANVFSDNLVQTPRRDVTTHVSIVDDKSPAVFSVSCLKKKSGLILATPPAASNCSPKRNEYHVKALH